MNHKHNNRMAPSLILLLLFAQTSAALAEATLTVEEEFVLPPSGSMCHGHPSDRTELHLASGAGLHLAVWVDHRDPTTGGALYVARFSGDGFVPMDLNGGHRIAQILPNTWWNEYEIKQPSVAFDGMHFVVAWIEQHVDWASDGSPSENHMVAVVDASTQGLEVVGLGKLPVGWGDGTRTVYKAVSVPEGAVVLGTTGEEPFSLAAFDIEALPSGDLQVKTTMLPTQLEHQSAVAVADAGYIVLDWSRNPLTLIDSLVAEVIGFDGSSIGQPVEVAAALAHSGLVPSLRTVSTGPQVVVFHEAVARGDWSAVVLQPGESGVQALDTFALGERPIFDLGASGHGADLLVERVYATDSGAGQFESDLALLRLSGDQLALAATSPLRPVGRSEATSLHPDSTGFYCVEPETDAAGYIGLWGRSLTVDGAAIEVGSPISFLDMPPAQRFPNILETDGHRLVLWQEDAGCDGGSLDHMAVRVDNLGQVLDDIPQKWEAPWEGEDTVLQVRSSAGRFVELWTRGSGEEAWLGVRDAVTGQRTLASTSASWGAGGAHTLVCGSGNECTILSVEPNGDVQLISCELGSPAIELEGSVTLDPGKGRAYVGAAGHYVDDGLFVALSRGVDIELVVLDAVTYEIRSSLVVPIEEEPRNSDEPDEYVSPNILCRESLCFASWNGCSRHSLDIPGEEPVERRCHGVGVYVRVDAGLRASEKSTFSCSNVIDCGGFFAVCESGWELKAFEIVPPSSREVAVLDAADDRGHESIAAVSLANDRAGLVYSKHLNASSQVFSRELRRVGGEIDTGSETEYPTRDNEDDDIDSPDDSTPPAKPGNKASCSMSHGAVSTLSLLSLLWTGIVL